MSEPAVTMADSSVRPRGIRTAILVAAPVVLVLGIAAAVVASQISELKRQVRFLNAQLDQARALSRARAEAVDRTLSAVVMEYIEAAQDRAEAGDELGAKAELRRAQALALALKDLGTGIPPPTMVAALTDIETDLGQPLSLPPAPAGGT